MIPTHHFTLSQSQSTLKKRIIGKTPARAHFSNYSGTAALRQAYGLMNSEKTPCFVFKNRFDNLFNIF
jgi:hypothetical protein